MSKKKSAIAKRPSTTRAAKPASSSTAKRVHSSTADGDPLRCAEVHVHPAKVEFFAAGETEPYSRMPNGAAGSDAHAAVVAEIHSLQEKSDAVTIMQFDVQGRPVEEDKK